MLIAKQTLRVRQRVQQQQAIVPVLPTVPTLPIVSSVSAAPTESARVVRGASVVNPADGEEFDEFADPPDLPDNNNDFLDEADLFDDEFNDPDIGELFDGINLIDPSQSAVNAQVMSTGQLQSAIVVNRRQRPRCVQRRVPTNALLEVIPTTKVRSKNSPILPGQLPFAFKSIADPANPVLQNDFGPMTVKCSHCGALHWAVERTNSLDCRLSISPISPGHAVFESCCKKGTVKLNAFHESPPELRNLLLDDSPRGKAFREQIRQYNSALTFTSLGYKKDDRPENQQGHGPFQIHGELYHLQGPLEADSENSAQYSQLFFYDPAYAAELRHRRNQNLDLSILQELTEMLHRVNPFIPMYKTAREQLREANNSQVRVILTPQLRLILEDQTDHRRYNLPTTDEVAVIIPEETNQPTRRDIRLANRGARGFQRISQNHPSYMPLHYTLLFPYGEPGWHWGMKLQPVIKEPEDPNIESDENNHDETNRGRVH